MNALIALIKKDLLIELRSRQGIAIQLGLSVLLSILLSFGVQNALLPASTLTRLFPTLIWFNLLVTGSIAITRLQEFEHSSAAQEGVLLTGTDPTILFCSKFFSAALLLGIGHLASCAVYVLLFNLNISSALLPLIAISAGVLVGYTALATLFSALTSSGGLRGPLLPLILLPLLFPLFFAAISLTADALDHGTFNYESVWASILAGLDLLYVALGINLYEHAIRG